MTDHHTGPGTGPVLSAHRQAPDRLRDPAGV